MTPPLISVIIPVFNGERYVAEAIESVLAQTYRPIEVLVVDDGSTDATLAVVSRYAQKTRSVAQDHQGAPSARNHGVQLARGDLLAFLDADDLWLTEKLTIQMKALQENSSLDAVFAHLLHFISPELTPEEAQRFYCPPDPMPGWTAQTFLGKRDLFRQVGLFNTTLLSGDFLEWYERAREQGIRMQMLSDVLSKRRIHLNNLTTLRKEETRKDYLQAIKGTLDRRRASERKADSQP